MMTSGLEVFKTDFQNVRNSISSIKIPMNMCVCVRYLEPFLDSSQRSSIQFIPCRANWKDERIIESWVLVEFSCFIIYCASVLTRLQIQVPGRLLRCQNRFQFRNMLMLVEMK